MSFRIRRHALTSKVAVDTNLLLLLVCIGLNRDPSRHRRLSKYTIADGELLRNLVLGFQVVVTTPNIITEASNLTIGYDERGWLREFIIKAAEVFIPSRVVVDHPLFTRLDVADLCMMSEDLQDTVILTDDEELANHLYSGEKQLIYHSDYRAMQLQLN